MVSACVLLLLWLLTATARSACWLLIFELIKASCCEIVGGGGARGGSNRGRLGEASNDASDGVPEDEDVFSGEWLASGVVSMLL